MDINWYTSFSNWPFPLSQKVLFVSSENKISVKKLHPSPVRHGGHSSGWDWNLLTLLKKLSLGSHNHLVRVTIHPVTLKTPETPEMFLTLQATTCYSKVSGYISTLSAILINKFDILRKFCRTKSKWTWLTGCLESRDDSKASQCVRRKAFDSFLIYVLELPSDVKNTPLNWSLMMLWGNILWEKRDTWYLCKAEVWAWLA